MRTLCAIVSVLGVCLLTKTAAAITTATCFTPLFGVGPVNPVHGFPDYYQDSTGLALQSCLDAVCGGAGFALPNPNLPLSFPDNFPVEIFYSRAIVKMTVGPMLATYVAALEGSFANGVQAVPGDQVVFSRIRVKILGAAPGGTYTVTHPYGVEVLQADSLGTVNFTQDSPRIPVGAAGPAAAFTPPITAGRVGPFLTALAPAPLPGLVGSPAANQTVIGSTCGTNFVRIEGPGFPAGGQQTDQFSTIIGKIAHVCGNGVVDLGEQCDDGNLAAGDCCSPTCQFEPAGQACANNPCISGSTCDGAAACVGGAPNTLPCNDGNACTTADTCAGGVCVGGPPPNCVDGNVCTTDTCDPATGCVNTPNTVPCDDLNPCTSGDTCAAGVCAGTPNTLSCDDGNACTTADTCAGGACAGGPPINCNDANVCTTDSCDPATGCVNAPNTLPCNDGNACTTADTCAGGACVGGPPPPCPPAVPAAAVTADAFVNSGSPTSNAGASTVLVADASPVKRTFLRINVTGTGTHPVTSAKLHLQVSSATGSNSLSGGQIHAISSCAWGERTITWNNQPPIDGPVLAAVGKVALKQGVEFDITPAIHGDGVYCFSIDTTSTDNVNYNSREATTGKPSVAITVAPDCGCGPVAVATTTTTTPVAGTTTTTLATATAPVGTVLADTYVQSDLPTTNFGTKTLLFVDNGVASNPGTTGVQHTFLRVSVSGVGAQHVTAAHLQLQVSTATNANSVTGGTIHTISNCSWSETAMTWNTAPAIDGPALVTLGPVAIGQVADFDVTSAISGDGTYCFAIDTANTDSAIYNSREGSLQHPALVVQTAP